MTLAFLVVLLIVIFLMWKLFIDGWLFKIIFFVAGCIGLYALLRAYTTWASDVAVTINNTGFSWAAVLTAGCAVMLLLTSRTNE